MLEDKGVGPLALVTVMLIGREPRHPTYSRLTMWSCHDDPDDMDNTWARPERAAIAYCLENNIPLELPAEVTP